MEKAPRFKVTKEGPYGPHLERVGSAFVTEPSLSDSYEPSTEYKLSEKQRSDLRKVLALVGALGAFSAMKAIDNKDKDTEAPPRSAYQTTETYIDYDSGVDTEFLSMIKDNIEQLSVTDIEKTLAYAQKPVYGYKGLTKAEYIKKLLRFRSRFDERTGKPPLPPLLRENLREAALGWVAQESRFKDRAVSKSGAVGIWQFLPRIAQHYSNKDKVPLGVEEQTKMAGELISDNYHYILHFAGVDALDKLRSRYDSEEEFIDDFMTPVMINAFNAGGPLMGKILRRFTETVSEEEMKSGKDLFLQVADFAKDNFENYRQEQYEYVPKVYAMGRVLKEKLNNRQG